MNHQQHGFDKINNYIDNVVLLGQTLFTIEEYEITGNTVLFLNIASFNHFIEMINEYFKESNIGN